MNLCLGRVKSVGKLSLGGSGRALLQLKSMKLKSLQFAIPKGQF